MNMKWKKMISKGISLLTVICCLAGTAITAKAVETGTEEKTEASGISRVVVVNEKERFPYLYVAKKVEGKVPESAKDDEFTFRLEIKRSEKDPYEEMDASTTYLLYDMESDPSHENPIKNEFGSINHKIGDFGRFTLKAGQEARFILGSGWSYRVTEEEKTGYRPKAKIRSGVMDDTAATAEFVNVYQGGGQGAGLRVEKFIQTMGNWTAAASPEFTFLLEVKTDSEYEPAEEEPYTLERTVGQRTETVAGLETDAYGKFKLSAEEAAVFSELPANGVYRVRELTPEYVEGLDETALEKLFSEEKVLEYLGPTEAVTLKEKVNEAIAKWKEQWPDWQTWWQKDGGREVREGSTMLAKTETFENSNISFGVSKRLEDGTTPEDSFTFQLSDGSTMLDNIYYYVYQTSMGLPVTEGETKLHTDDEGKFTLQAGQTAVFTGMKPERGYVVNELNENFAYKVKTPETGSYSRSVENEPERLIFTNDKVPAGLVVSKSVVSAEGEVPGEDAFRFILEKQVSGDGATVSGSSEAGYVPVAGEPYEVGSNSGTTGEDGSFTLMDKQTAVFAFIAPGTYRVKEILNSESMKNALDYQFKELVVDLNDTPVALKDTESAQIAQREAELPAGGRLTFHFTNTYAPRKADIEIWKVGEDGEPLTGAEFKLHRSADLRTPVINRIVGEDGTVTEQDTYTVDGEGKLSIKDLKAGTYWLEEVRPPSGYRLLSRAVQLEIARKEGSLVVSVKGVAFTLQDPTSNDGNPQGLPAEQDTGQEEVTHIAVAASTENPGKPVVTFTVCNDRLYDLPHAGGIGIVWYIVGGVLLMMAAALILYKNNLLRGGNAGSQH